MRAAITRPSRLMVNARRSRPRGAPAALPLGSACDVSRWRSSRPFHVGSVADGGSGEAPGAGAAARSVCAGRGLRATATPGPWAAAAWLLDGLGLLRSAWASGGGVQLPAAAAASGSRPAAVTSATATRSGRHASTGGGSSRLGDHLAQLRPAAPRWASPRGAAGSGASSSMIAAGGGAYGTSAVAQPSAIRIAPACSPSTKTNAADPAGPVLHCSSPTSATLR